MQRQHKLQTSTSVNQNSLLFYKTEDQINESKEGGKSEFLEFMFGVRLYAILLTLLRKLATVAFLDVGTEAQRG